MLPSSQSSFTLPDEQLPSQYCDGFFFVSDFRILEKMRFKGTSRGMYFHLLLGVGPPSKLDQVA